MSNIRIGHMTLGIYQPNCYFVYRENSDKVLVFDPADHGEKIEEALGQHGLHTAEVIAVGEGIRTLSGELVAPSVKVGDTVLVENHAGVDVKDGDEKYTIVGTASILAIVEA